MTVDAEPRLRLGFEDERDGDGINEIYSCCPFPKTRAVVWQSGDGRANNRVTLGLYFDPPIPGSIGDYGDSIAFSPNRCLPWQVPIEIENEPLLVQLAICDLVERYKATLPSEVTNDEEA